jgi:hypothetical protein
MVEKRNRYCQKITGWWIASLGTSAFDMFLRQAIGKGFGPRQWGRLLKAESS